MVYASRKTEQPHAILLDVRTFIIRNFKSRRASKNKLPTKSFQRAILYNVNPSIRRKYSSNTFQ